MLTDEERLAAVFRDQLLPHIVMLICHLDPGEGAAPDMSSTGVIRSGSGVLVDTTEARFIVTAAHVEEQIRADGNIPVVFGDSGKNIRGWKLIASDHELDIATIGVPPDFDPARINRRFWAPGSWPLPCAVEDEPVALAGFPEAGRTQGPGDTLNIIGQSRLWLVAAVSDRTIVIHDPDLDQSFPDGAPVEASGMSGCPVFVRRKGRPELAGVVKAGRLDGDLYASRADFIQRDGSIDHGVAR